MIELMHPHALWLLLLIPLLMILQYVEASHWNRHKKGFFHLKTFPRIIHVKPARRKLIHFLEYTGLFLCILALSGPGVGTEIREVQREGVDILIALDLSQSMSAADVKPSRLERAKLEIVKMFSVLKGDRVGLIGFAGVAHLQCPLTLDHRAARMLLDVMDVSLLPVQGSAIADAVTVATGAFPEKDEKHKVLILISDGEDHEKQIEEAVNLAESKGVIIYTLGVGTLEGAPIPVYKNNQLVDYKRDKSGKVIITQLNEDALWQMAHATGGEYLRLTDVENPLLQIYNEISKLEKKAYQTHEYGHFKQLYQIFSGMGLLLFLVSGLIPENGKRNGADTSM